MEDAPWKRDGVKVRERGRAEKSLARGIYQEQQASVPGVQGSVA